MSGALNSLFYTQGIKSFLLFFVRWKWTYIDMFLTLMFIPVCVLMCIWLPIYYIYVLIYHGIKEFKYHNPVIDQSTGLTMFWKYVDTILIALSCAFVLMFILQALLAVALEHKRIKAPVKKMMPVVFTFPLFMIIYAAAITIGVFSKPKWHQVKRNVSSVGIDGGAEETTATDGGGGGDPPSAEERSDA